MSLARAGLWLWHGGELALSLGCRHFCVSTPGASVRKPSPQGLGNQEGGSVSQTWQPPGESAQEASEPY